MRLGSRTGLGVHVPVGSIVVVDDGALWRSVMDLDYAWWRVWALEEKREGEPRGFGASVIGTAGCAEAQPLKTRTAVPTTTPNVTGPTMMLTQVCGSFILVPALLGTPVGWAVSR